MNRGLSHHSLDWQPNRNYEADRENALSVPRERILKRMQAHDLCEFDLFSAALLELCESKGVSTKEVSERLEDFRLISTRLLGPLSGSTSLTDTTCAFLIKIIYDSYYVMGIEGPTSDHRDRLCSIFDPNRVTVDIVNKVFEHSRLFLDILKDSDWIAYFFSTQAANIPQRAGSSSYAAKAGTDKKSSEQTSPKLGERVGGRLETFSMAYRDPVEEDCDSSSSDEFTFDVEWLYGALQPVALDMELAIEDLIEMVRSNVCDVQQKSLLLLEQELMSLMGLNHINLIRDIVAHRSDLITSFDNLYTFQNDSSQRQEKVIDYKSLLAMTKKYHQRPGQSIVVQTEEEKRLFKLARKAEKKLRREQKKATKSGLSQGEINRNREERAEQLINAMAAPLFKKNDQVLDNRPQYEFVFDSFNEVKSTASFVAGCKMILPVGCKRTEDQKWEEMTIPAPPKPSDTIIAKYPLKRVSELDEVAKVGFTGMERLNQIQSMVYETAYTTGENMLVCAPTGAGKTNIAMLTILREIKSNITEDGNLRLNSFKIIYIAPMKALVAEMVDNFSKKLKPFGIRVCELTGDMQMTKAEIAATQMIVTTPEKWDVITRKTSGIQLLQLVKLTIIDEVHLLESDRGPVLEALVSRIIRNVEATNTMSRLVGLSATLPNYVDVAEFLGVDLHRGLFMFDSRFRPVPLELSFVGVKSKANEQIKDMDDVCYEKIKSLVTQGHQVMIFVHSRNATYRVASKMIEEAQNRGHLNLFAFDDSMVADVAKTIRNTKNKQLVELLQNGFAMHHAGLLRSDRNLIESLFRDGGIRVLACTATLAWGVNLPAHAVIIRGTDLYDPSRGNFVDLSMLDVMQIFGRAGRPQYDSSGFACIITSHDKLSHYLSMLTLQFPIESNFLKYVTDNLNAEIVAGTVSNVTEGTFWLRYTYLTVRMKKNPLHYGLSYQDLKRDPHLQEKLRQLIVSSADELQEAKMIEYDIEKETFKSTDLGRAASHYYIKYDTVCIFNEKLNDLNLPENDLLRMLSHSQEFDQLKTREEEMEELTWLKNTFCKLRVDDTVDSNPGKVNVLIQTTLSRGRIETFSLQSDANYVAQNVVRLVRGLFEYCRKSKWTLLAHKTLLLAKMLEKKMWNFETPFRQLSKREVDEDVFKRLDQNPRLSPARFKSSEFTDEEVGRLIRNAAKGKVLKEVSHYFPSLKVLVKPTIINHFGSVIQVRVEIEFIPDFKWSDYYHGKTQGFWMWLFDPQTGSILHDDYVVVAKSEVTDGKTVSMSFRMALHPSVTQFVLHLDSDYWLGCDQDTLVTLPESEKTDDEVIGEVLEEMANVFKETQDVRDPGSNVKITSRVRDREAKLSKTDYAKKQEAIKISAENRGKSGGGRRGRN